MQTLKTGLLRTSRARRGFTLVELVIVGALITLFSTLAIFGVQQQFSNNLRKATIGETRQIATALDFANLDTSIFPRLCWLSESTTGLDFIASQMNSPAPYVGMDVAGRPLGDTAAISRIRRVWNGPYFAMSQARVGTAQGRGGFVYMIIPDLPSSGPNSISNQGGLRWPADPYFNPYTVYMLDLNLTDTSTPLQFVTETTPNDPTKKGDFVNAVVSYGPNHYPGGEEWDRPDF